MREEIAQCVKSNKTGGCDGIVGELLSMAVQEWCVYYSSCFLLFDVRSWFLGSGGRDLLLIYLRKGIKRTRAIIEILRY